MIIRKNSRPSKKNTPAPFDSWMMSSMVDFEILFLVDMEYNKKFDGDYQMNFGLDL